MFSVSRIVLALCLMCSVNLQVLSCPVYFLCNTGPGGLGDQLEHYVYCLYCAKLLNATVIVDGFRKGPTQHLGTSEYHKIARHLGIDFSLTKHGVEHNGQLFHSTLSFADVFSTHQQISNGSRTVPCNTLFQSDIYSCPGDSNGVGWCDFLPKYESLKSVLWTLRRNHARKDCFESERRTAPALPYVRVVWHVRTGDVCLRCNQVDYFEYLYTLLLRMNVFQSYGHDLTFESQGRVDFLENHALFQNATFFHNSSLMDTVCRFLTADVLITSGSSLPVFIAAFAPPWAPIVLEERRKEAQLQSTMAHHFFNEEEAVLLEDGRPLISDVELSTLFENILGDRLTVRQRSHDVFA